VLAVVWLCCSLALPAPAAAKRTTHHPSGLHIQRIARPAIGLASSPPALPVVTWWQDRAIVATRGRLVLHDGAHTEPLPRLPSMEHVTALYTQEHTLFVGHSRGVYTLDLRSRRWGPSVSVQNVTALAAVPDTPLIAIAGQAPGRCLPVCSWDVHGGLLHQLDDLHAGFVTSMSANTTHLWAVGNLQLQDNSHYMGVYTQRRWQTVPDQALPCAPHAVSSYGPFVATQCSDTQLFHYNGSFVRMPVPSHTRLSHLFAYAGEDGNPVVLAAGALPHANSTTPFAQLHEGAWHELASYVGPPKVRNVLGIGAVVGVSLALGLGTTFALVVLSTAITLAFQALRYIPPPGPSQ